MSPEICVVIPALNASDTIGHVVRGALHHVTTVIVADDGSTDNTAAKASEAGADVVVIESNRGKGNALKTLFREAIGRGFNAVITMDADEQHDPQDIPLFLDAHRMHPQDIVVGSRMHEGEKIPRSRYNSMQIARFYISLASNQFIDDTQCGFRLYPLSMISRIILTSEGYVTETEILIKSGDMGTLIRCVRIRAIYDGNSSHFRPVRDLASITLYIILYLTIKWSIECVYSDRPFTYRKDCIHDMIGRHRVLYRPLQFMAVFTALPFSFVSMLASVVLSPIIGNNFASIRRMERGLLRITLSTYMLPVLLMAIIIEEFLAFMGINTRFVDGIVGKWYRTL